MIFAKRYHKAVSPDALVAGLPVEPGHSSPELFSLETSKAMFSRVASRAGLAARLVQRDLSNISRLLLPCILVMGSRGACILEEIDREKKQAKVILPEIGEGETWIDLDTIDLIAARVLSASCDAWVRHEVPIVPEHPFRSETPFERKIHAPAKPKKDGAKKRRPSRRRRGPRKPSSAR